MVEFIHDVNAASTIKSVPIMSTSQSEVEIKQVSEGVGGEGMPSTATYSTDTKPHKHEHEHPPTLGWKEMRALKKAKYYQVSQKFQDVFVLKNVRTGMVVELKASTSFQACKLIGWKPNQVVVVEHRQLPAPPAETPNPAPANV